MTQTASSAAISGSAAPSPAVANGRLLRPRGGGGSSSNEWELTPVSLLIRTLGYVNNDTLMMMCLVCKQIRDLIWSGQGMENKLVRIFELSPSKNMNNDGHIPRLPRFLSNMNRYFQNVTKTRILRGFQHGKVQQNGYKFNHGDSMEDDELERRT